MITILSLFIGIFGIPRYLQHLITVIVGTPRGIVGAYSAANENLKGSRRSAAPYVYIYQTRSSSFLRTCSRARINRKRAGKIARVHCFFEIITSHGCTLCNIAIRGTSVCVCVYNDVISYVPQHHGSLFRYTLLSGCRVSGVCIFFVNRFRDPLGHYITRLIVRCVIRCVAVVSCFVMSFIVVRRVVYGISQKKLFPIVYYAFLFTFSIANNYLHYNPKYDKITSVV